ncbi:MAG: hypothetical protein ACJ77I_11745 [Chloroflexota bacterium]
MRTNRRHLIAMLIALATLLAIDVAPASALTGQRTWTAKVGTAGANGKVVLRSYTNGVGSIQLSLKGLRRNATYSIKVRNGTCANPGTAASKTMSFRTSSTGTVSKITNLLPYEMTSVWAAARKPGFIIRMASGTSNRCGAFKFRHATRVVISTLGISLPVIRGTSSYPKCGVAMYTPSLGQPREPWYTFVYAHARRGMFLPMLTQYRNHGAAGLLGRVVKVYTSDSAVSYYKIVSVKKTYDVYAGAYNVGTERLRLQTSTGPNTSYAKLIADAVRYKTVSTTYAASHPTPHPYSC